MSGRITRALSSEPPPIPPYWILPREAWPHPPSPPPNEWVQLANTVAIGVTGVTIIWILWGPIKPGKCISCNKDAA